MSMRKLHQKSRLGCGQCKKRHVKCDLNRPECNNCSKRALDCSFRSLDPKLPTLKSGNHLDISSQQVDVALPPPTFLDILVRDGLLDVFPGILQPTFKNLLRHFATETSATITHTTGAQAAWCAAVPQLSSNHQFVLKGISAISALHLSRTVGTERERKHFNDIAAVQINTGLVNYKETVQNVNADNAEALFSFSVTVTAFIIVNMIDESKKVLQSFGNGSQNPDQRREVVHKLSRAVVNLMFSLRGVLLIIVPCWNIIANGMVSSLVTRDWWPHPIPTSPQAIKEDRKIHEIRHLWMQPGRRYEYWFEILIQSLKQLQETFALVSQLTMSNEAEPESAGKLVDWSAIFTWPIHTPHGFVSLLDQKRPEAWVILAHWAILPSRIKGIWWVNDLAPSIVSIAALVLGKEMWKWIEWPASTVGVDLESLQPLLPDAIIPGA